MPMRTWIVPLLLLPTTFSGQPIVDITMADNGAGQLEVRVRPQSTFEGIVSNLTFTIRWPESAGLALDTANALFPAADYMYPAATAVIPGFNGYLYRTFNAVGMVPMTEFGYAWQAGVEYPLCTIDILAQGTQFTLGNDAWTSANNRDFFCSLNGYQRTGLVYPSIAPQTSVRSEQDGDQLRIILTPQGNYFGWVTSLDLTLSWLADGSSHLGGTTQQPGVAAYLPMVKDGPEVVEGGRVYQRFHGEGLLSIANAAEAWWAGQDVEVLTVPLIGNVSDISVADDAWTVANDGGYRILLNGQDVSSGVETSTGIGAEGPSPGLSINAVCQQGRILVSGTTPVPAGVLELELLTLTGQQVYHADRRMAGGRIEQTLDIQTLPEGIYLLSARVGGQARALRLVL